MKLIFLLGRQNRDSLTAEIEENGDILIGDFIDSFRNLTHKGKPGKLKKPVDISNIFFQPVK